MVSRQVTQRFRDNTTNTKYSIQKQIKSVTAPLQYIIFNLSHLHQLFLYLQVKQDTYTYVKFDYVE